MSLKESCSVFIFQILVTALSTSRFLIVEVGTDDGGYAYLDLMVA